MSSEEISDVAAARDRDRETRDRALFDAIAKQYCRKDMLPAHRRARQLRLFQTLERGGIANPTSVLEVGCGAGFAARYLLGRYGAYLGIDYSSDLIAYAQSMNTVPAAEFRVCNANEFESDRKFDVIFMIGVLHHLPDPVGTLRHLRKFLKKDGVIAVNEPQRGNPLIHISRLIRKKLDPNYSADQDEYTRKQIFDLMKAAGLDDVKIYPQGILTTPFAEVIVPLQAVASPFCAALCAIDRWLESAIPSVLTNIAWNAIAVAKPHPDKDAA